MTGLSHTVRPKTELGRFGRKPELLIQIHVKRENKFTQSVNPVAYSSSSAVNVTVPPETDAVPVVPD